MNKITICLFALVTLTSSIYAGEDNFVNPKSAQDDIFKMVSSLRNRRSYNQLGEWFSKNIKQDSDLNELYKIAQNIRSKRLKKAIAATVNAVKQGASSYITNGELLQLALFIETNVKQGARGKRCYFNSAQTKLPRSIEVDPINGKIIVYLEGEGSSGVGKGWLKRFNTSLLYGVRFPKVVATGFFKVPKKNPYIRRISSREVKIRKKLDGKPGVVKPYSFIKHRNVANNKDEIVFVERLYRGGSIRDILKKKSYTFTFSEKIKLALDFISGLKSIHQNGVIHNDLHTGNYLVDVYTRAGIRVVSGALTDFGKARLPKNSLDDKYVKMRKKDIFRLGLSLYGLFHNEYIDHYIEAQVASREEIAVRRDELIEKKKNIILNSKERFELLILNMISKEQNITIDDIFKELKAIYSLVNS